MFYPLISANTVNITGTLIAVTICILLLVAMFLFIRVSTDESEKYKDLKEMIETLFGTPAHLRPDTELNRRNDEAAAAAAPRDASPFSEPCPACGHTVSEQHAECPSCGLRLM
ncbi:hypothetical protein [Paenibacillus sp. NEAU-GSW1]|uniref:hypothetical protein n=1 Tax=Paenibacillus sp. NEAU-GSW1 TaxID=2682486 RepID=UPI0012E273D3|nr:hypothetical protein [Paenibacillus sp. NEAU-GSW1]MUT65991.1 hypothetical protein [Paenibacillus sp. NEAU-GSW1]